MLPFDFQLTNADELQVVRDSLQSLRSGFLGADPHQHTIDTLEQSISTLIEKLHTAHSQVGDSKGLVIGVKKSQVLKPGHISRNKSKIGWMKMQHAPFHLSYYKVLSVIAQMNFIVFFF